MKTGEGASMLSLEERVQRVEKLAKRMEKLARRVKLMEKHVKMERRARRVKRMKRLALPKKKHARRLAAEERAKMELRATKPFAEEEEEEDSVKMELRATEDDQEFTKMEDRVKKLRAIGEMEMRIMREASERRAKLMGKPVADAAGSEKVNKPVADAAGSSEEGNKPVAEEAGSKQGKRKRTRKVRLNQAGVDSVVPFRRPPFPPRMPDWMLALAPEEIRKEELQNRALFDKIEAFCYQQYIQQYILKGYVEVEVTDDDEPGVQE